MPNLAIRRDRGLGDLLMLTPSLRALTQSGLADEITIYCNENLHSVFSGNLHVHQVKPSKLYQDEAGQYDRVVDLNGYPERQEDVGALSRVYLLARGLGVESCLDSDNTHLDFYLREDACRQATELLVGLTRPFITLSPFSRDDRRSWGVSQVQHFVDLCRQQGIGVIFTHSNDCYEDLSCTMLGGVRRFWGLDTHVLAAILFYASCVVSVDTGVYHLAVAAGGGVCPPLVLPFASTDPCVQMEPYEHMVTYAGVGVPDCMHYPCAAGVITGCHREAHEKLSCTREIPAEAVFEQVVNFLEL